MSSEERPDFLMMEHILTQAQMRQTAVLPLGSSILSKSKTQSEMRFCLRSQYLMPAIPSFSAASSYSSGFREVKGASFSSSSFSSFSLLFSWLKAFSCASFSRSISFTLTPFLVENFFLFYPSTTPKPICSALWFVSHPAFLAAAITISKCSLCPKSVMQTIRSALRVCSLYLMQARSVVSQLYPPSDLTTIKGIGYFSMKIHFAFLPSPASTSASFSASTTAFSTLAPFFVFVSSSTINPRASSSFSMSGMKGLQKLSPNSSSVMCRRLYIFWKYCLETQQMEVQALMQDGSRACSLTTVSWDYFLNSGSLSNLALAALQYSSRSLISGSLVQQSGKVSFMQAMSMPNWVPQSPTWLALTTLLPRYSWSRQNDSPRMVLLRWPTCISLAMLGDEKSTTIIFSCLSGYSRDSIMPLICFSMSSSLTLIRMKPLS